MNVLPGNTSRCRAFVDAYQGKPTDWRALMAGWGSAVDHPTTDFVPELMAAFPEATVILSVRDSPAVWWKSYSDTIKRIQPAWNGVLLYSLPPAHTFWRVGQGVDTCLEREYGTVGPEVYELHNKRMMEIVPKEKMLVFNVKEGWEPLCTFLGVQVPKVPFPRVNDTKDMRRKFFIMRSVAATAWVLELGLLALLVRQVIKRRWWEYLGFRQLGSSLHLW